MVSFIYLHYFFLLLILMVRCTSKKGICREIVDVVFDGHTSSQQLPPCRATRFWVSVVLGPPGSVEGKVVTEENKTTENKGYKKILVTWKEGFNEKLFLMQCGGLVICVSPAQYVQQ